MTENVSKDRTGVRVLTGGTSAEVPPEGKKPAQRGTSNGNDRGGSETRRRRRAWLIETYRADQDVIVIPGLPVSLGGQAPYAVPACRCYRCGKLLTSENVTVDRIIPGCQGGTYRRSNIRPACGPCNSVTGGAVRGGTSPRSPRSR